MRFAGRSLGILVVALTTLGTSASAQQAPDPRAAGPYQGLFGGNPFSSDAPQTLDFSAGLFGGYDDDVTSSSNPGGGGGSGGSGDPRSQKASTYAGGSANLRYSRRVAERVTFDARGGFSSSYYDDLDGLLATSYGAAAALNWNIRPRTSLHLAERFRYSPFFGYSLFEADDLPGDIDPGGGGTDTRVVRRENFTYVTSLGLSHRLSTRSSVSASAYHRRTDFTSTDSDLSDTARWGAGGQWSYRLTEYASARAGYYYRTGSYSDRDQNLAVHSIDAGIDYSRALSFSRRTYLSFSTGTTGYSKGAAGSGQLGEEFRYTVVGSAQLTHEIGQSWTAAAFFSRRVRFFDGFADPFLSNAAGASISGYLGPRARLSLVGGLHWGEYGSRPQSSRNTRTGYVTPAFQYAITRNLAAQASYFYYRYFFGEGLAPLPPGVVPDYSRQGFRVMLSFWTPLVRGSGAP